MCKDGRLARLAVIGPDGGRWSTRAPDLDSVDVLAWQDLELVLSGDDGLGRWVRVRLVLHAAADENDFGQHFWPDRGRLDEQRTHK